MQGRGHREEDRVLEDYAAATGHRVEHTRHLTVEGPEPLVVSPDGLTHTELGWGDIEAKTDTSGARWGDSGEVIERWTPAAAEVVREDYAAQVYAQLAATGLPYGVLVVRRSLDDLRWYTLLADPRIQAQIVATCRTWWERHIATRTPPEVDDSEACRRALARLYPPREPLREATDEELALVSVRRALRAELAERQAELDHIDAELMSRIGDARGLELGEGRRLLWVTRRGRTTIDTQALRLRWPHAYAEVRREGEPTRHLRETKRRKR